MKTNIKAWLLAPSFLILTGGLFAQGTPAASPAPAQDTGTTLKKEDLVVLSPFVVTSDGDVGYQSNSTLAGTRLKSDLRDIGSSISIVNQEFLRDTASSNLEDVLIFTPNTEVGGLGGNFSGAQGGNPVPEQQRDSQGGGVTRIRGLASADLTRDYFITDTPFDAYNTERVEVQRGANSALFGLGSPGGIINSSTIKADFLSNRGQLKAETDSYGTQRYSMRYNYMLNKYVAIHVAGLRERTKYEQKQAYSNDERAFIALTAKLPFGFVARGSYESVKRWGARPDYVPPNDGITPWINMGKPVFNTPAEAAAYYRGTGSIVPGVANSNFFTPNGSSAGYNFVYGDPTKAASTYNGPSFIRAGRGITGVGTNTEWMTLQPFTDSQIIRRSGGFRSDGSQVAAGTSGFWSNGSVGEQITDRSVYDYRKNLFSGGSSTEFADWVVYTASLENSWFDGRLGMELSYFNQRMNTSGYNALQGVQERTIYIDPNRYLIGTSNGLDTGALIPNPSFGKPIMGGLSQGNNITIDREAKRATGFVELRAEDFMSKNWISKLLGKLTITGLVESNSTYDEENYGRDQLDIRALAGAFSGGVINGAGINQADGRAGMIFALPYNGNVNFLTANSIADLKGANIGGVTFGAERDRPPGGTITGWDSVSKTFKTVYSPAYTLRDNNHFPSSFSSSNSITKIDSQVFVAQHYLWDKAVVLTGTWRKDDQSSGSVGAPQNYPGVPAVENVFDPVYLAGPVRPLHDDASEETRSWSIMIHTPDFLKKYLPRGMDFSVYRSKASNFRPSGGRRNIFNETVAPVTGATEENGFIVSAFDGKLQGRFNFYKTGVLNNSFDKGGVSSSEGILLNLVNQLDNPNNVAKGYTANDVKAVLPSQGVQDLNGFIPNYAAATATTNRNSNDTGTQDFTSKGLEFELSYNPTSKWTILMSVAKQNTVTSNTYPAMLRYVHDFVIPNWVDSTFAKNYFIDDLSTQTLSQVAQSTIVDPVLQAATEDGSPAKEQRQWRWALNTSYKLGKNHEMIPKFLGNVTVGGGVRWEDKLGIGFPVAKTSAGNLALDPTHPFYAPSQTFADVFIRSEYILAHQRKLSVQLNIKDITNHNGLVPFLANPDGSKYYRIQEGRLMVLAATLEF
jgi:outer membrane receptor protein involved in Fe transport